MRGLIAVGLTGVALISLSACNKPTTSSSSAGEVAPSTPPAGPMSLTDLPHHKAGLWRNTMTIEGMQQPMPVTEMCMDAASEAKMSVLTKTLRDRRCASESLSRNLDGSMSFKSTCDMGAGGHKESTGTIVGDMTTNYKMSLDSKTTGAASLGMNGETKMTIASVWLGPCAAGQKGGDVIMPGGKVVNMGQ